MAFVRRVIKRLTYLLILEWQGACDEGHKGGKCHWRRPSDPQSSITDWQA